MVVKIKLNNEEYVKTINGLWTGKKKPFKSVGVIRNTNFSDRGIIDYSDIAYLQVEEKKFNTRSLAKGDIIIERSGGGPKQPVGRVVYFDKSSGDFSFSNFTSVIRVIKESELLPKYLLYHLLNFYNEKGTYSLQARTTGIRNLDFNKYLSTIELQLIEIGQQNTIIFVLDKIQSAIETQENIIKTTTELKRTLMQKLFTEGLYGEPQKNTEIGKIPKSWGMVQLQDVCEHPKYGYTDSAAKSGTAKFLRITDIQEYGVVWDTVPFCNCPESIIDRYLLRDNDIVFARIGATTGKSYIINKPPKAIYASYLIRVRVKSEIDAKYLYYYFNTDNYWWQVNSHKGASLKGGVNGSILKTLLLPLPPKKEQIEIAKVFNVLDIKINFNKDKKEKLQLLFKSMLHQLMTGQIRVKDLKIA